MSRWSFALKLFGCLLGGTALAWGASVVCVLALHAWPYPALVVLLAIAVACLWRLDA
jgi:hypothetical protein